MNLTDEEKLILQCIVDAWDASDIPMYGNTTYEMVQYLLLKLELQIPPTLKSVIRYSNQRGHYDS